MLHDSLRPPPKRLTSARENGPFSSADNRYVLPFRCQVVQPHIVLLATRKRIVAVQICNIKGKQNGAAVRKAIFDLRAKRDIPGRPAQQLIHLHPVRVVGKFLLVKERAVGVKNLTLCINGLIIRKKISIRRIFVPFYTLLLYFFGSPRSRMKVDFRQLRGMRNAAQRSNGVPSGAGYRRKSSTTNRKAPLQKTENSLFIRRIPLTSSRYMKKRCSSRRKA